MATRIPKLGAPIQAQAADTPFQNVRTTADMFGGGNAKVLQEAGSKISAFGKSQSDERKLEDKRALLKSETLLIEEEARIATEASQLIGQEKIDYLSQNGGVGKFGPLPEGVNIAYSDETSAALSDHAAGMSEAGQDSLNILRRNRDARFSLSMSGESIKAQRVVDAQLAGARISAYGTSAVSAVGQVNEDGTSKVPQALADAKAGIKSTINDPEIGLGRGLDPEGVEVLEKKQTAAMVAPVIVEMAATGDINGAIALLEIEMEESGSLRGTVEGTQLQGKLLKQKQGLAGIEELTKIVKAVGSTEGKDVIPHLQKIKDPVRAAAAWFAYTTMLNKKNALGKSQLVDALITMDAHFKGGGSLAQMDRKAAEIIAQFAPNLFTDLVGKGREIRKGQLLTDADANHTRLGGNPIGSIDITANYMSMSPTQLAGLLPSMDKTVRPLLNTAQFAKVKLRAQKAAEEVAVAEGKAKGGYYSVLASLGFKKDSTKYKDLAADFDLQERVFNERMAYWEKTGSQMPDELLRPMIGEQVLKVRTQINPVFDDYGVYALSVLDGEAGVDVGTLLLQTNKGDFDEIGAVYGVSKAMAKLKVKELQELNRPVTLNNLDTIMGHPRKSFSQATTEQSQLMDDAMAAGYTLEFMQWYALGKGIDNLTHDDIRKFDEKFKSNPSEYILRYGQWVNKPGGS